MSALDAHVRKSQGKFRNKVVVITGASAGVGRATARAFAREGAKLALIARGQAGLDAARREIEMGGGTAISRRNATASRWPTKKINTACPSRA